MTSQFDANIQFRITPASLWTTKAILSALYKERILDDQFVRVRLLGNRLRTIGRLCDKPTSKLYPNFESSERFSKSKHAPPLPKVSASYVLYETLRNELDSSWPHMRNGPACNRLPLSIYQFTLTDTEFKAADVSITAFPRAAIPLLPHIFEIVICLLYTSPSPRD